MAHYSMDCFFLDAYGVRLNSVPIIASNDDEAISEARGAAAGMNPSSFRLWAISQPRDKIIFDSAKQDRIGTPRRSSR